MSSSLYSGYVLLYYPIQLTTDNNQIVFDEGGTTKTLTFDPGIYWAIDDLDLETEGVYTPLYEVIDDKLTSEFSEFYDFFPITPTDYYLDIGIELDGGSTSFSLNFSSSNFTMDPRLFGFPESTSTDKSSSSEKIQGTISQYGLWASHDTPSDLRYNKELEVFRSRQGPGARINQWTPDMGSRRIAFHGDSNMPAAFVYPEKANDSDLASQAGLAQNDTANGLRDVFESLPLGDVLAGYNYSSGDGRLAIEDIDDNEILEGKPSVSSFRDWIDDGMKYGNEAYDVEFELYEKTAISDSTEFEGFDTNG